MEKLTRPGYYKAPDPIEPYVYELKDLVKKLKFSSKVFEIDSLNPHKIPFTLKSIQFKSFRLKFIHDECKRKDMKIEKGIKECLFIVKIFPVCETRLYIKEYFVNKSIINCN